eukprot:scaffold2835_cov374-Prasinococcus_capsulatus_cf.AAC.4
MMFFSGRGPHMCESYLPRHMTSRRARQPFPAGTEAPAAQEIASNVRVVTVVAHDEDVSRRHKHVLHGIRRRFIRKAIRSKVACRAGARCSVAREPCTSSLCDGTGAILTVHVRLPVMDTDHITREAHNSLDENLRVRNALRVKRRRRVKNDDVATALPVEAVGNLQTKTNRANLSGVRHGPLLEDWRQVGLGSRAAGGGPSLQLCGHQCPALGTWKATE